MGPAGAIRVMVATKPVDFRKGAEGLAALVRERLEDGRFNWPAMHDGVMRLSAAQFQVLFEGLDWRRVHDARRTARPTATSSRQCGDASSNA